VVEEVRCRERHVDVAALLDRLAVVEGLQDGELAGALLHDSRDPEEVLPAIGTGHPPPHAPVCRPRGFDGTVDVVGGRLGDLGEGLLGGRVNRLEGRAGAVDELSVDEQAVGGLQVDDGP
jgi:hypothetical protein